MTQHSSNADAVVARPGFLAPRNALQAPSRQAYEILHWGFTAAPVLFGIDKLAECDGEAIPPRSAVRSAPRGRLMHDYGGEIALRALIRSAPRARLSGGESRYKSR